MDGCPPGKRRYSIGRDIQDAVVSDFFGAWIDEIETQETISDVFNNYGYVLDPHSAVAYKALQKYRLMTSDETYGIVLSTASPFKFSDVVLRALYPDDYEGKVLTAFEAMDELSQKVESTFRRASRNCAACRNGKAISWPRAKWKRKSRRFLPLTKIRTIRDCEK